MIWLYRLQQRLSITRQEGLAVITLTGLLLIGLGVRHVQEQRVPPAAVDSLVARAGAPGPADSTRQATTAPAPPSPEQPVRLNSASRERLQALDGIGPALSERIVQYRSKHPFQRVRELRRVRGIGPKTLAALRPVVAVTGDGN
ncbi:MAG: ComEA family DNA-binding protein [Salinibacter sp.]